MLEIASKRGRTSRKNCVFFEAGSKMKNCVWTAPARADRGSDLPEKLTKTQKNQPANQHTYNTDFTPKVAHNIPPKPMKISPGDQLPGLVSPNPFI